MGRSRRIKSNACTILDDVTFYLARGCDIHPLLLDYYHDLFDQQVRLGNISLTPRERLRRFNRKLRKTA